MNVMSQALHWPRAGNLKDELFFTARVKYLSSVHLLDTSFVTNLETTRQHKAQDTLGH